MTDLRHTRPLTQVEVESRIAHLVDAMEEATDTFEDLARKSANAEADFRKHSALAIIAQIQHGEKMTVGERTARAEVMSSDDHRAYLIARAARDACREHLTTMREQLNALRTVAANIRGQS